MHVIENAVFNGWSNPVNLGPPPFPAEFYATYRLTIWPVTIDPKIGSEVMIFINDPTEQANDLANLDPFRLRLTIGGIQTSHGFVGYTIFSIPNPDGGAEPFAAWEQYFDPHNPEHLKHYEQLAVQSHWHVMALGPGPEVLNVAEFANIYELGPGLAQIREAAQDIPTNDFGAAIGEVQQQYNLAQLYCAGFSTQPPEDESKNPMDTVLTSLFQHVSGEDQDQARKMGEVLNEAGGMELMVLTHRAYSEKFGDKGMPRLLEMYWSGIGQWRS